MYVKVGTYTGSGADNPITGFGFAPVAGMIKRHASTAVALHIIKTSGVTHAKPMGANATTDDTRVTLDADGFTAKGTSVEQNSSGGTYDYIMWGADAADMAVFEYSGDTTDGRSVGSFTFTPDMAWVLPSSGTRASWRSDQTAGDSSHARFDQAVTTNIIQAFNAGSIEVGTAMNAAATTYYVAVWKKAAGVFATAEYSGDGTDDRNIAHGLSATPVYAYIQGQGTTQIGVMRFSAALDSGDITHLITNASDITDGIQAMDGTNVQLGASSTVNLVTGSPLYTLITFGENAPAAGGSNHNALLLLGVG